MTTETKRTRKLRPVVLPDARPRDKFVAVLMEEGQYEADTHGDENWEPPTATFVARTAAYLIRCARTHNTAAVSLCNGWSDQEQHDRKVAIIEARIMRALADLGPSWGATFSYDPRGCTVRLKCPSGRTNDWGGIGYCVPI